jgi:NAD(P)-dependent dehydrogenase (short-subunit alcohol dehydrogenase family)
MAQRQASKQKPAREGLEQRVVVVTDADRDRGRDVARAIAPLHAAVVVTGDDVAALGALAAELGAAGARVAVFVEDVTTETGRSALVEMVNDLFPRTR